MTVRTATVVATSPLTVRLDGDTTVLPVAFSCGVTVAANDRVLVAISQRRVALLGKAI